MPAQPTTFSPVPPPATYLGVSLFTHVSQTPQKQAAEETKNVFGPLRSRIVDAVSKLEEQIAIGESSGDDSAEAELTKAREVLKQGQDALKAEE